MYAVLQKSLDQVITIEALEDAVRATQQLTKPDCPLLRRDLFGIVASSLSREDALGMQRILAGHGVETRAVEESNLPVLSPPKRALSFTLAPDGLRVIEFTSPQETVIPGDAFVFAAAGHVKHLAMRPHAELELVNKWVGRGGYRQVLEKVTRDRLEDVPEFRVEFFFAGEPFRLQWILDDRSVLHANGGVFHRRDCDRLRTLLAVLAGNLPVERVNQGIARAARGEDLVYPSVHAFEEEIVWSFYQLTRSRP